MRKILQTTVPEGGVDLVSALPRASQLSGQSQLHVALDLVRSMIDARKMEMGEYFMQGGWLPEPEARRSVVGSVANLRLNRSLTAMGTLDQVSLMNHKFFAGQVLEANGFPVPVPLAVFAKEASFGGVLTLRTVDALTDWLCGMGPGSAFAKPQDGSMALGSVPLRFVGDGRVDIGGTVVEARALATEVAQAYARGWLIQEQLRQPAEIEALIGPGIGTVRVVTLWEEGGPQVLYGVWRHPAPGTWVDAAIHGRPNVGCALDSDGVVIRAQQGNLFTGREVTHSLITPELALIGYRLAQWAAMSDICREAHRLFPGHALIGWDIAMTERGPVISELNANPLHMSYQRSSRRGFLHAGHRQRLEVARRLMLDRAGLGRIKGRKG